MSSFVFDGRPVYGGNWQEVSSRSFNADELNAVQKAEVVASEYGNSVCFFMVAGGQTYIPLSNKSSLNPGDTVDLKSAKIVQLHRDGNEDIIRIMA